MAKIIELKKNKLGQDWFVGDIHGCYSLLEKHLEEVQFDPVRDRLICTGDLIDRGPESERALEFLQQKWFYSVLGNHDNFINGDLNDIYHLLNWYGNGGSWWWYLDSEKKNEFIRVFAQLPYLIEIETETGTMGVVHAELPENIGWNELKNRLDEKQITYTLLWSRHRLLQKKSTPVADIELIISGHTMLEQPVKMGNCAFIDVGACVSNRFVLLNQEQLLTSIGGSEQVDIIYNRYK